MLFIAFPILNLHLDERGAGRGHPRGHRDGRVRGPDAGDEPLPWDARPGGQGRPPPAAVRPPDRRVNGGRPRLAGDRGDPEPRLPECGLVRALLLRLDRREHDPLHPSRGPLDDPRRRAGLADLLLGRARHRRRRRPGAVGDDHRLHGVQRDRRATNEPGPRRRAPRAGEARGRRRAFEDRPRPPRHAGSQPLRHRPQERARGSPRRRRSGPGEGGDGRCRTGRARVVVGGPRDDRRVPPADARRGARWRAVARSPRPGSTVVSSRRPRAFRPPVDAVLGWAVREGVTNIVRHGGPRPR